MKGTVLEAESTTKTGSVSLEHSTCKSTSCLHTVLSVMKETNKGPKERLRDDDLLWTDKVVQNDLSEEKTFEL